MQSVNWIQLFFGFISGGATGAFIKQYFDNRKNKIQKIGYYTYIKSFYDSENIKLIQSKIVLQESEKDYVFSRIFTGSIVIINSGYLDYNEFKFGLTCNSSIKFIHLTTHSSDRHHNTEIMALPSLEEHTNSFDAILKPFNRKDSYRFDFIITSTDNNVPTEKIQISSPHPVLLKVIPAPRGY